MPMPRKSRASSACTVATLPWRIGLSQCTFTADEGRAVGLTRHIGRTESRTSGEHHQQQPEPYRFAPLLFGAISRARS